MRPLRKHLEQIMQGLAGTGQTIPTGKFQLGDYAYSPLSQPNTNIERMFWVGIEARTEIDRTNQLDGFGLYTYPTHIFVTYELTKTGNNLEDVDDTLQSQDAGGAQQVTIEDRIQADLHQIQRTLEWTQNWPFFTSGPLQGECFGILFEKYSWQVVEDRVVADFQFNSLCQIRISTDGITA